VYKFSYLLIYFSLQAAMNTRLSFRASSKVSTGNVQQHLWKSLHYCAT